MDRVAYNKAIALIDELIAPMGYECVEVEWDASEGTLRVFIDGENGIVMSDCLKANSVLVESTDLDLLVKGDYRLEISSPGIERPLRKPEHFTRYIGQNIKIKLFGSIEDRGHGTGKLLGVDAENVVSLQLATGVWSVPLQEIRKARLLYEW